MSNLLKQFLSGILLVVVSSSMVDAKPIAAGDLFRSNDSGRYRMNPQHALVTRQIVNVVYDDVIELVDLDSAKVTTLFSLVNSHYSQIYNYYWIDADSLFIDYRVGEQIRKKIIIDIDIDKYKRGDAEFTSRKNIKAKGKIIDTLINIDDTVLFQREVDDDVAVFRVSTKALVDGLLDDLEPLKDNIENAIGYDTDGNGNIEVATVLAEKTVSFWYLTQDKKWIQFFTLKDRDYKFIPAGIIADGKLAVITDKDLDLMSLVEFDMNTQTFGEVLYQHPKYDLVDADISKASNSVLSVSYYDHGRYATDYFADNQVERDAVIKKHFNKKQYFLVSENIDKSIVILFVFNSNDPGKYYSYQSKTKKFSLLSSAMTHLDEYSFTKSEVFTVNSENDIKIEAILTKPEKSNGVLLVAPHGGPVGVRDYDSFSRENQYLASRGFSILNVNFRGSAGFGKKFMSAGRGQFGKLIEQDITKAVDAVKKKYQFERQCSIGTSYGGYSAMILAIFKPEQYDCVVAMYGIYDLGLLYNASNLKVQKEYRDAIAKVVGEFDESLKEYSPFYLAEKLNASVLLVAGKEDSVSGFEQSNRMKFRLKQLGKLVETIFYENTEHGHSTWKGDTHQYASIDSFLRRSLGLDMIIDKDTEKAYGEDVIARADAYQFEGLIKTNKKQAFELYKEAAEMNEPRAVHNVGSYYHRGEFVDENIQTAIEYYIKASELGYEGSSYRLGEIYRNGNGAEIDEAKSFEYFSKAEIQGSSKARYEKAKALCMGKGVERDLAKCFSVLTNEVRTKSSNDAVAEVRKYLAFAGDLSKTEQQQFIDFVSKDAVLSVPEVPFFEIKKQGFFSREHYGWDHKSSKYDIEIDKDSEDQHAIGVWYIVKDEALKKSKKQMVVKVEWTYPEIPDESGDTTSHDWKFLHFIESFDSKFLLFNFNDKKYRVSGQWKLEIKTLSNEVLFSQVYNVKVSD